MQNPRRTITILITLTLLGALAACTSHRSSPRPNPDPQPAFDRRAAQVVAHWPQTGLATAWATGFVPLQPLTIPPADSEFTNFSRQALLIGAYTFPAAKPPAAPSRGNIVFPDGSTMGVPLEPWSAAHKLLSQAHHLPACTETARDSCSLTVTGIRLGTAAMLTSRGQAVVPAWLLTTTQLADPIARVAIPLSTATVQTSDDRMTSDSKWFKPLTLLSVVGNSVTYEQQYGAGCDGGGIVRPLVYETSTAVVIGGTETVDNPPKSLPPNTGCVGYLFAKPVTVTLAAPLGVRPLLNIEIGCPVYLGELYGQFIR